MYPCLHNCLVEFGRITSQDTENVCSSGLPEENRQVWEWLGAGLLKVGWGRAAESTCRHARFQLSLAVSWLPEALLKIPLTVPLCSNQSQLKLGVIFAYLTGCSG